MASIWIENLELMEELKEYATTYVNYVRAGGHAGDFPDALVNKAIAISVKIKQNRDHIWSAMKYDIPSEDEECKTALDILNGDFKDNRLHSVIDRIYTRY